MMEDAKTKGITSEKMMWQSIDDVDDMLCALKIEHPDKYWKFIRKTHEALYNGHYTEEFARHDVEKIQYTNKAGEKKQGPYWSVDQVEDATRRYQFPQSVNKWDKWVAANAAYSDFCRKFDDSQILDIMYLFYFADEDWKGSTATKIWDYMYEKFN